MDDLREFFFFTAGWNMASSRKYGLLIPFACLPVGSIWPYSVPLGYMLDPAQPGSDSNRK